MRGRFHKEEWHRQAIYSFGAEVLARNGNIKPWTKKQCERAVKECYTLYGLHDFPDIVTVHRNHKPRGNHLVIYLPPWARHPMYVCHEAAHGIDFVRGGSVTYGHGTTFARVFVELLHHVLGIPKGKLLLDAKRSGVVVSKGPKP